MNWLRKLLCKWRGHRFGRAFGASDRMKICRVCHETRAVKRRKAT